MKLELEDLTKDELLRLIGKHAWPPITQRDLLSVRWGSLTTRAQDLLSESIKAGEAHDWKLSDDLYNKASKLLEKANAVWAETRQCPIL